MIDLAIKILAVVGGIWAAFASYPYLNDHVFLILAIVGAAALGVLAGALIYMVLIWVFGGLNLRPRN